MKTTLTALVGAAAIAGLLSGATARAEMTSHSPTLRTASSRTSVNTTLAGNKAVNLDDQAGKHDCKGKNDCKGKGGCKSGDNGCKGQNSCKGKGGCKAAAAT